MSSSTCTVTPTVGDQFATPLTIVMPRPVRTPFHYAAILEWDGEKDLGPGAQGLRGKDDREDIASLFADESPEPPKKVEWEAEPQMTAEQ